MIDILTGKVKNYSSRALLVGFAMLITGCAHTEVDKIRMKQESYKNGRSHESEFIQLTKLVGDWVGTDEAGAPVKVNYKLSAADSALVETWYFHNGVEALTIYHLDGERLLATHYCPIGNQPRFALSNVSQAGMLTFDFESATNLADMNDPHGHMFDIHVTDDNAFVRNETYVDKGQFESNGIVFSRVQP